MVKTIQCVVTLTALLFAGERWWSEKGLPQKVDRVWQSNQGTVYQSGDQIEIVGNRWKAKGRKQDGYWYIRWYYDDRFTALGPYWQDDNWNMFGVIRYVGESESQQDYIQVK